MVQLVASQHDLFVPLQIKKGKNIVDVFSLEDLLISVKEDDSTPMVEEVKQGRSCSSNDSSSCSTKSRCHVGSQDMAFMVVNPAYTTLCY